ncbi:MAG TPA: 2-oxoglutarate and iron-dependent oxygenase domain-containing protein [Iamia sp.]|nr:2-oxoglutarate and iron-dependent oxygenase domain-containing protein [Iamia sp.]
MPAELPRIDLARDEDEVARAVDAACRSVGFFTVVGHGIDPGLQARMDTAARAFFARPEAEKAAIAMAHGGRAWRGWFPLHGELTSGVPDHKEGFYVGRELPPDDRPLHGPNLWPAEPADLRPAVTAWMDAVEGVAQRLARAIGIGLGLGADWFARHLTADPTVLFRIFRYPPVPPPAEGWGVAEHTDYGLLTLLAQDHRGGLQVRGPDGWIDVPPEPGALVVNLGDMLDRMTGGRYRSTPHRVVPTSGDDDRLSFPFFFDPSWDAEVRPLPLAGEAPPDDAATRWDGTSLRHLDGTYGAYLTAKVARVFPALAETATLPPTP